MLCFCRRTVLRQSKAHYRAGPCLFGEATQIKFNVANLRITGTSGTQQNKYNRPYILTGDYFMEMRVKDAKGNVSNIRPLKITVTAKEFGQSKVYPSFGGGLIEKVLRKMN